MADYFTVLYILDRAEAWRKKLEGILPDLWWLELGSVGLIDIHAFKLERDYVRFYLVPRQPIRNALKILVSNARLLLGSLPRNFDDVIELLVEDTRRVAGVIINVLDAHDLVMEFDELISRLPLYARMGYIEAGDVDALTNIFREAISRIQWVFRDDPTRWSRDFVKDYIALMDSIKRRVEKGVLASIRKDISKKSELDAEISKESLESQGRENEVVLDEEYLAGGWIRHGA